MCLLQLPLATWCCWCHISQQMFGPRLEQSHLLLPLPLLLPRHCSRRNITACDKRWAQTRTRRREQTRGDSSVNGMACGQDIRNWHPCVAHLNAKIYPTKPSMLPHSLLPWLPSLPLPPAQPCHTLILFAEIIFCRCFRSGGRLCELAAIFTSFIFGSTFVVSHSHSTNWTN